MFNRQLQLLVSERYSTATAVFPSLSPYRWIRAFSFILFASSPFYLLLGHGEKGNISGNSGGAPSNELTFPSHNMEVLGHLSLADMGGDGEGIRGSDIWGWTDPETGKEYAIVGRTDGVAFVDISNPRFPQYLGLLPRTAGAAKSVWTDFKTYQNKVYIVADNSNNGLQIFDLTQLRGLNNTPRTFSETQRYDGFKQAHNIAINEETGYAFALGAYDESSNPIWAGGMMTLNLNLEPSNDGFSPSGYSGDGYTHDSQVVTYRGPDTRYRGRQIAFNSNEDTLTIVSFPNIISPTLLSRTSYSNAAYVHQGWLTEDHRYFLSNDELDEIDNPSIGTTRTHIWNVQSLRSPQYMGFYDHGTLSTDHNLYIHNGHAYTANYSSGLRVLNLDNISDGILEEVAWVDTNPSEEGYGFDGAWSVYPFFDSGSVIIGDVNQGLVIVRLETPGFPQDMARWKEQHFSVIQLSDHTLRESIWGEEADPDGDGYNNLSEYAFDLDPEAWDKPNIIKLGIERLPLNNNQQQIEPYLTLTFPKRIYSDSIEYQIEVDRDLDRLTTGVIQPTFVRAISGHSENVQLVTLAYAILEPSSNPIGSVYARLRVSKSE